MYIQAIIQRARKNMKFQSQTHSIPRLIPCLSLLRHTLRTYYDMCVYRIDKCPPNTAKSRNFEQFSHEVVEHVWTIESTSPHSHERRFSKHLILCIQPHTRTCNTIGFVESQSNLTPLNRFVLQSQAVQTTISSFHGNILETIYD